VTGFYISADIAKLAPGALMDFGDRRLAIMDENRVDFVVLSLAGPGVQVEKDAAIAERKAHAVNDFLAAEIQKRPARYGGFAHLAMQNPSHAADELERCIRDLGFQGALINGQTNGEYLDLDKYSVFWERVAELEAPVYLHPANPVDHPATFSGHSELWGPVCSWAFETATHALRLVFAGIFERYPQSPTHSRARRRDPAFQPVAFRQPLVGLQSSRPHAFQSAFLLHPAKHCRYHLRHVLGSPSALLSRCHGRGERNVLHRLSVREDRSGRAIHRNRNPL
jgi:hypothetical protein